MPLHRRILSTLRLAPYGGDELLLLTIAVGGAAWLLWYGLGLWAAVPLLPLWIFLLSFFRDPRRPIPGAPGLLLAPADGTVADIEEVEGVPYLGGRAVRVGIFLSPLNVHINRVPCAGMVEQVRCRTGEFLPAYHPDAPTRNESVELGMLTDHGFRVLVKQITGVLARRIVCEAVIGTRYERGARYGMIKFGSRTELYVPADCGLALRVTKGERVRGGVTVLFQWTPPQVATERQDAVATALSASGR